VVKYEDGGILIQIVVYVNSKKQAKSIESFVNDLNKDECEQKILCRSISAKSYVIDLPLSRADNKHEHMFMIMFTVMIGFFLLM